MLPLSLLSISPYSDKRVLSRKEKGEGFTKDELSQKGIEEEPGGHEEKEEKEDNSPAKEGCNVFAAKLTADSETLFGRCDKRWGFPPKLSNNSAIVKFPERIDACKVVSKIKNINEKCEKNRFDTSLHRSLKYRKYHKPPYKLGESTGNPIFSTNPLTATSLFAKTAKYNAFSPLKLVVKTSPPRAPPLPSPLLHFIFFAIFRSRWVYFLWLERGGGGTEQKS